MTDCFPLRLALKEKWGDLIVSYTDKRPEHVENSESKIGIQLAAAELWLFGMTDFQIITQSSSFGRLGALRSLKWHSIFTVREATLTCDSKHWDTFEEFSMDWTRV